MSRTNGAARRPRRHTPALPVLSDDGLYLNEEDEQAIQHRLSRLEGQVRGIKRMFASHQSCDDILVQVAALSQAASGVASELVQAHMATCVLGRIEAGRAPGEGFDVLWCLTDRGPREQTTAKVILEATR